MGGEACLGSYASRRLPPRRAQVAIEYLFVMGFAFVLITPLILLYYTQSTRMSEGATSAAIERAARQIAEAADTVYYLGAPSSRTITVDLPDNVKSVQLSGQAVTFSVASSSGAYEQNAWSGANLTGGFSVSAGPHVLVISAQTDGTVNVTER